MCDTYNRLQEGKPFCVEHQLSEVFRGVLTPDAAKLKGSADCHPGRTAYAVIWYGATECRECWGA